MNAKTSIPTQRYSDRGDIGHTHTHTHAHAHTHTHTHRYRHTKKGQIWSARRPVHIPSSNNFYFYISVPYTHNHDNMLSCIQPQLRSIAM